MFIFIFSYAFWEPKVARKTQRHEVIFFWHDDNFDSNITWVSRRERYDIHIYTAYTIDILENILKLYFIEI